MVHFLEQAAFSGIIGTCRKQHQVAVCLLACLFVSFKFEYPAVPPNRAFLPFHMKVQMQM